MPFDASKPLQGGVVGVATFDKPEPSYLETVGAWMRQDNPVFSAITSARRGVDDFNRIDPTYDPFDDIKGYEQFADRFETVYNPEAAQAVKASIDQEQKDRQTQAQSGWVATGLGMGAALVADPTILLPGGVFVRAGQVGYRGLRSAASVGSAAALGATASELALQATQETRPFAESALTVGGSAILGGIVGAAGAKFFTKTEWDRVGNSLREQLAEEVPNPAEVTDAIVQRMQSVGASAVDEISLDDLGIGGGRAAQIVAKATEAAKINPGIQTMFSPSKKVRETYAQMVDNPVYTKMNMEGRTPGADVENLVKEYARGRLANWITSSRSLYRQARKEGFEGTRTDFYSRVARAGRRGDVDELGNPQVTKAAQEAREKIFDPLLERAIKNKMLPEDVKVTTAASYVTRLWNRQKLIGEEERFREIARNYFRGTVEKLQGANEEFKAGQAAVKLRKATDRIEEIEERLAQLDARGRRANEVLAAKLVKIETKDQANKVTLRDEDELNKTKDQLTSLRSEYAAERARHKEAASEYEAAQKSLDDFDAEVKDKPRVKAAVEFYKARRDMSAQRAKIAALREKQVGFNLSNQTLKADNIAREISSMQPGMARLEKQIARLSEVMKNLEKNRIDVDFVSPEDMDDYLEDIVTSVFNNLTGRGDVPEWLVPATRGPLKERTFNIPDEMVEDFLENDMELIMRRYSRTMAAEVELTEKFGRADMRDQIDGIRKEYEELSKAAKTPQEREKLRSLMDRDVKNLEAFRDMIRGTYRAAEEGTEWSKITRAALAWNFMRLLGGMTITSLADAARLLAVPGLRATMREALPSLIANTRAVKISKQDARDLGAVTEMVLQSRLASLADLNDPYRYQSGMDRYLANATNLFSKATGLGWWNDTVKSMASVMTQNRMARNSLNWAKAGERERAYMAYLGINEDMAGRIAKQIDKHGEESQGIWGANVSEWEDEAARRAWGAALNKDVDRTIVTKGVADTPLWMKTNWGRLLFQFKSFAMASHQRVLIAGLQERPHRFAEQLVFGTSIGMMISYAKMMERGDTERAEDLLNNPGKWVADGLDRTGILSLPFEATNTADKVVSSYGGPNIGINRLFSEIAGDENTGGGATRYASRNATGAIAGPTVGLWEDLAQIATALAKQDFNRGSANALIRQIPGATLPGARTAIHVGLKPEFHEAVE